MAGITILPDPIHPSFLDGVTLHESITNPDFVDTEPSELVQMEVILKGESVVNIEKGDGQNALIIFKPTAATRKAVINYEGWDVDLTVDDPNGLFKPRVPQVITGHIWCENTRTLVIDTENQS